MNGLKPLTKEELAALPSYIGSVSQVLKMSPVGGPAGQVFAAVLDLLGRAHSTIEESSGNSSNTINAKQVVTEPTSFPHEFDIFNEHNAETPLSEDEMRLAETVVKTVGFGHEINGATNQADVAVLAIASKRILATVRAKNMKHQDVAEVVVPKGKDAKTAKPKRKTREQDF